MHKRPHDENADLDEARSPSTMTFSPRINKMRCSILPTGRMALDAFNVSPDDCLDVLPQPNI
jgi:hypothetical protein